MFYELIKVASFYTLVSRARLAKQLRLEAGQDAVQADELDDALKAAHEWVEQYVGYPIAVADLRMVVYEESSEIIQLPRGSVPEQDDEVYTIQPSIKGPKLTPVTVWQAGYELLIELNPIGAIPDAVKAAVLMVAADLYDNRSVEPVKVRTRVEKMLDFARQRVGL